MKRIPIVVAVGLSVFVTAAEAQSPGRYRWSNHSDQTSTVIDTQSVRTGPTANAELTFARVMVWQSTSAPWTDGATVRRMEIEFLCGSGSYKVLQETRANPEGRVVSDFRPDRSQDSVWAHNQARPQVWQRGKWDGNAYLLVCSQRLQPDLHPRTNNLADLNRYGGPPNSFLR